MNSCGRTGDGLGEVIEGGGHAVDVHNWDAKRGLSCNCWAVVVCVFIFSCCFLRRQDCLCLLALVPAPSDPHTNTPSFPSASSYQNGGNRHAGKCPRIATGHSKFEPIKPHRHTTRQSRCRRTSSGRASSVRDDNKAGGKKEHPSPAKESERRTRTRNPARRQHRHDPDPQSRYRALAN